MLRSLLALPLPLQAGTDTACYSFSVDLDPALRGFDDPDDLVSLIRDLWVGGRPFRPDGLPVIDRVPEAAW